MPEGFTIDLQDYCSNCADFEPELEQLDISACGDRAKRVLNSISCENASRCAHLMESLKNRE